MRSPQPSIPKPAKSSAPPESHVRPGYETPAISAGAAAVRLALRPCRKVAWFCYAPLADFYSAVDTSVKVTQKVAVGTTLPTSVELYPLPADLGLKSDYRYGVVGGVAICVGIGFGTISRVTILLPHAARSMI